MKYIDLHCDALTKTEGVFGVTKENLRRGGCLLQCFAAFVDKGAGAPFSRVLSLCDKFDELCKKEGYHPVRGVSDICFGKINAMLTVEEGGVVEGDLCKLEELYRRGVRMMTLTWNYPNEIGWPHTADGGLTPFGRECVKRMAELRMLADVSHGSDRLVREVAEALKAAHFPFVASHSGAREIFRHSRNLGKEEIRLIAESGGVIGLDFCADFLSADKSAAGQREALLAHAGYLLRTGGEEILALGSDFDGMPENPYMKNAACVGELLLELEKRHGARVTEKIAYGNALRVLAAC